jgi:hypothetical protein
MKMLRVTVAILAVSSSVPAVGANFDGSKILICAPVEAMDCGAGQACTRGLPESIGAPGFMRVDVAKKIVSGPNEDSPIQIIDTTEERLLLQGKEQGFGWTLVVEQDSGRLTTTLVDENGVFVLFGNCMAL